MLGGGVPLTPLPFYAFSLSGYPPFYADSAPALFKKIMDVKYDFDDSVWDDISDSAKDLIRNLLVKDPSKRYTASQCLDHAWVKGSFLPSPRRSSPNRCLRFDI